MPSGLAAWQYATSAPRVLSRWTVGIGTVVLPSQVQGMNFGEKHTSSPILTMQQGESPLAELVYIAPTMNTARSALVEAFSNRCFTH